MRLVRLLLFFGVLAFVSLSWAHDPGLSSARFALFPDRIELVTTFSLTDARWLRAEESPAPASAQTKERIRLGLAASSSSLWQVMVGGAELVAQSTSVELVEGNNVVCTQQFPRPTSPELRFSSTIFALLPPGHRQHATVVQNENLVGLAKLLSQAEPGFEVQLPPPAPDSASPSSGYRATVSFASFFRLGIEHILTGYDHLLFLLAFLLTAQGLKLVLKLITSFTIAHSITLALSAFDLVSLPSRVIEPLIAATIVFVALQNLGKTERPAERVGLTFTFGLIHGFGFASVLREMGISSLGTSAWRALAGFNAGVEVGQIAVAALILPLLWSLRSRKDYERRWAPAASAVIALFGLYWLVQRLAWA